ncbi:circadian locomoter output cycles protein kaput [Nilaparvata lugens]|uniref:circadian locomoter output cycles protein kaput n=1 Tax=Nilaparvata lugens TaxID=108931 RepID=UPI00193D9601|nr:circadian locomoter output cycles protein kaput [Nilaparvata lugens]
MSYLSRGGLTRRSDDTMDDDTDDKDDTKRKSRNLSEKKRRDQFNMLINELSSMVSTNSRKMDKSTVLKSTIAFLKNHNEIAVRSSVNEIQEEWKPSFLSNEEFAHLILEALDGFIMVFSSSGRILYASESITSLLGHLPNDLLNTTIYDIIFDYDHSELYNILLNPTTNVQYDQTKDNQISFICHCKRGNIDFKEEAIYELVQFVGYFRADLDSLQIDNRSSSNCYSGFSGESDTRLVFVGTGRLQTPQLIREMSLVDSTKSEFTSRHSLEWKFLFLDHRAPPIIGYLPFEVLGTSGYDYYHVDDLDRVVSCHEALMQKGEGTSCYYRFLTKGQQWIWLQTRFYITYHQWNSKPEFIVCTHRVVSYINVLKQMRKNADMPDSENSRDTDLSLESSDQYSNDWSSKSILNKTHGGSRYSKRSSSRHGQRSHQGSDSNQMSADSPASRQRRTPQKTRTSRATTGQTMLVQSEPQQPPPAELVTGFAEPQTQPQLQPQAYPVSAAAIPVQPVLAASFPAPAAMLTSIHLHPTPAVETSDTSQPLVMTSAQMQLQDELQRKHEQLQQHIMQQQDELRRVSEQLLMARYGLFPQIVTVPYPASVHAPSNQQFIGTPVAPPPPPPPTSTAAEVVDSAMPLHFGQQPSQMMFSADLNSPNSTQHSQ